MIRTGRISGNEWRALRYGLESTGGVVTLSQETLNKIINYVEYLRDIIEDLGGKP